MSIRSRIAVGLAAAALLASASARAATHVWNPTVATGVWNVAGNWSMGGVPTSGEMPTVVQIGGGVTATDNIPGLVIDRLVFTDGGNTVAGSGVTLTINTPLFPTNLQSMAGTNVIASSLPVAFSGVVPCGVIVDAGTLTLASNVSGQGFILQFPSAAGTLTLTGNNSFGPVTVREGVVTLASSTPNVAMPSSIVIGDGSGAINTAVVAVAVAEQIADGANVTVNSDGRLIVNVPETISNLVMTGGTVAGSGSLNLSTANLTATSDAAGNSAFIGVGLPITFVTFATVNDGPGAIDLDIAGAISGAGTLQKEGPGTLLFSGSAANTNTGTTFVNGGTLILGKSPGVNAIAGPLTIGVFTGTDTVSLATSDQIADTASVAIFPAGVLDLNGQSEAINALNLRANTSNAAQVKTGGGTLTLGGDVTVIANGTGAVGASITGNLALGGATRTFTVANGAAAVDLNLAAAVTGTGGILKMGPGTLRLTTSDGYTGGTTVNEGTLLVTGTLQNSQVTVASTGSGPGTLGGTGTVAGVLATTGIVSPGTSPGFLSSSQNVALQAGSTFSVELDGTTPGTQYDVLSVTGAVTLGAALSVSVGFAPSMGNSFLIVSAGTVTGTFAGLPEGAALCANGRTLQIHYLANGVTLTVIATTDTTAPAVTAPSPATVTQTLCQ